MRRGGGSQAPAGISLKGNRRGPTLILFLGMGKTRLAVYGGCGGGGHTGVLMAAFWWGGWGLCRTSSGRLGVDQTLASLPGGLGLGKRRSEHNDGEAGPGE